MEWYREIRRDQWRVLMAATLGMRSMPWCAAILLRPDRGPQRVPIELGRGRRARRGAHGDLRAGRSAVRISLRPVRAGTRDGLVDSLLFHADRFVRFGAHGNRIGLLAGHCGYRVGRRMGGRIGAGSRNLAGAASRQRRRADAIRLGHRLPVGGDPGGIGAASLGLASLVPAGDSAGAVRMVDSPRHCGTASLAEERAVRAGFARRASASAFTTPAGAADGAVFVPVIWILGIVHLDSGLPFHPD